MAKAQYQKWLEPESLVLLTGWKKNGLKFYLEQGVDLIQLSMAGCSYPAREILIEKTNNFLD